MAHQGGYAVVDVDEEFAGDIGGQGKSTPSGLQFQNFLDTNAGGQSDQGRTSPHPQQVSVPYSPFNLTYYQGYFDVTTATIRHRCFQACIPKDGFINDVCEERIDLYGPFWVLTTLILSIYLSSSLSSSLSAYIANPDAPYKTDLTLLSLCVTLIYCYGLVFPALFWAATKWVSRNESIATGGASVGIAEWTVVEALALWGYAMGVFIPVSVLCVIPIPIMRWILVGGAAISSGYFLVRNVYPVLSASSDSKLPRLLIIVVVVLHAAIALTMKIMFFSYSVAGKTIGPNDPISGTVGEGTDAAIEMIRRWIS